MALPLVADDVTVKVRATYRCRYAFASHIVCNWLTAKHELVASATLPVQAANYAYQP